MHLHIIRLWCTSITAILLLFVTLNRRYQCTGIDLVFHILVVSHMTTPMSCDRTAKSFPLVLAYEAERKSKNLEESTWKFKSGRVMLHKLIANLNVRDILIYMLHVSRVLWMFILCYPVSFLTRRLAISCTDSRVFFFSFTFFCVWLCEWCAVLCSVNGDRILKSRGVCFC